MTQSPLLWPLLWEETVQPAASWPVVFGGHQAMARVGLEAMKMEIAEAAPFAAIIERLNCVPGNLVTTGQNLVTLRQEAIV